MLPCRPSLISADVFIPLQGLLPGLSGLSFLQHIFPSNLLLLEILCGSLPLHLCSALPLRLLLLGTFS